MQIQPGQLIKDLFRDREYTQHPNKGECLSEEWPGKGTLLWQLAGTTTEHFEVETCLRPWRAQVCPANVEG